MRFMPNKQVVAVRTSGVSLQLAYSDHTILPLCTAVTTSTIWGVICVRINSHNIHAQYVQYTCTVCLICGHNIHANMQEHHV